MARRFLLFIWIILCFYSYQTKAQNSSDSTTAVFSASPGSPPTSSPGSPPASSPGSLPASSPGSLPASSPGSPPASSPGSLPASSPGTPPASSPGSPPASSPGSPPASSPGSLPASSPGSPPASSPGSPPASSPGSPPTSSPGSPPASSPGSTPASSPGSPPTTATISNSTSLNNTTAPVTNALTTITTVAPPRPGEYTVKARMGLTFGSGTYIAAYANTSSPESLSFTNDIFNKMQSALQNQSIRLTEMIINSIRSGSIIVDMQVTTASASAQTDAAAVSALQSAVTNAYGANVTSTVNITQSSSIVTASSPSSTRATATISNSTSLNNTAAPVTNALTTISTVAPPKPGEYTVKARMGLTFGSGTYIAAYNNTASPEYLSFTNDIFNKMQSALLRQAIRLIEIIINSIRSGSIIVDMQVTTASASAQTDAAAVNALQNAVTNAYGANVTSTVNITQSSSIVPAPPSVTTQPKSTGSTVMFSIISVVTIGFSVLMMEIGK